MTNPRCGGAEKLKGAKNATAGFRTHDLLEAFARTTPVAGVMKNTQI